jgi:flavin reductase (DIM6/NTAB) family NADH-FMN oxidoreductase RutF
MTVDDKRFKHTLARWTSGVTVVTTHYDNAWQGITVSSFSSVSLEPPLILICIGKQLYTNEAITTSGAFAVNILKVEQVELGKRFAGMIPELEDRFEGLVCETANTGAPILPGVSAWLDCRVRHAYDGGDHTIFVGEVMATGVGDEEQPLLYYNRQWGTFIPDDGA